MEKGEPSADASMQEVDGASDCSDFSVITPPTPPSVPGCSKCAFDDETREDESNVAPVESDQERTRDEKHVPTKSTEFDLDTPEPCIHSLTAQSEYLRSKLNEVEAALERYQRPAAAKSANANASTATVKSRTTTTERQNDDQKQTVASLQEECRQLLEKVNRLSGQNRLEDKHCRSSDANDPPMSKESSEDLLPTLTPSELEVKSLELADRNWCIDLLKMATSILEAGATLNSPAPASPSDGKKKKKKCETKSKTTPEIPLPPDTDPYGMPPMGPPPPVEPPLDPFQAFFGPQPPKKWTDVDRIDVRWWIRTVLNVCHILRVIGVIILVFKAPGMLRELLNFMQTRDRCIGIRIRR